MAKLQVVNGVFTVEIYRGDTSDIFIDRIRTEVEGVDQPVNLAELYSDMRFQIRRGSSQKVLFSASYMEGSIQFVSDSDNNENSAILIPITDEVASGLLTGLLKADLKAIFADGTAKTFKTEQGNQTWKIIVKEDYTR